MRPSALRPPRVHWAGLLVALAVGLALTGAGSALSSAGRSSEMSVARDRLVFVSTRTGIGQLYVYDLATRRLGQLTVGYPTTGPPDDASITWARVAPGGGSIAVIKSWYTLASILEPTGALRRQLPRETFPSEPWSPDGRRLLVQSRPASCSGPVRIVRADGQQVRVLEGATYAPTWSRDGRWVAAAQFPCTEEAVVSLVVVSSAGGRPRVLLRGFDGMGDPSWSPDGRALAVVFFSGDTGAVWVVPTTGGSARRVSVPGVEQTATWSPAGDWIAYVRAGKVELVRPDGRGRRVVAALAQPACPTCSTIRWSPNGKRLALSDARGLRVYATATRRLRTLDRGPTGDIAWAPSGTQLVYVATKAHALRLVGLTGATRTLHTFTANAAISSLQWSQPPVGTAAKPPEPVPWIQQAAPGAVKLRTPIVELAANGDTLAYLTCGNVVGRWRPSTGTLEELLPEWATPPYTVAACSNPAWNSTATSGIALADRALAYWRSAGGNSKAWWLSTTDRSATAPITGWRATTGNPPLAGWTVGGGELLVFSARRIESVYPSPPRVVEQSVWRVREPGYAGACPTEGELKPGPCQLLATEPGPFLPYDVDAGRIVAAGDNAVVLLDGSGTRILTVPVRATAAALSGDDLVVLVPRQLRHYSATTGALLRTWPLPDVTSGAPCSFGTATYLCPNVQLRLWDTARGLAVYTLDGQIHLLRLADGTDTVLATGTAARFVTTGLVYATTAPDTTYPYCLAFVPNTRLP